MLFDQCNHAFKQERTFQRARQLGYGQLTCFGKHTVTGMLTSSGQQFIDWSSAYRLFSKNRIDTQKLFEVSCKGVLEELASDQMIIAHMDDTVLEKTGKKVPGTAWRRDPLGPPFQTNFIWGQRFLQISMAVTDPQGNCQSRAIPVDFHHCPTVKKPGKSAQEHEIKIFKEEQKIAKLSKQGSLRIQALRDSLDSQGAKHRQLYASVDGSYTNEAVLKTLPDRVTLIGRIRKDTKLYKFPDQQPGTGRKRAYGDRLPTPEQIRQSDQTPWQLVKAWAAGKSHDFDVKVVNDLRWRSAGQNHDLQLVIIRPLGYRLTKTSRILYRQPAYLICTDNNLDLAKLLQAYLWRWEIEVNFRDEKNLLGCGQAQVTNPNSVENVPAFITALYAFIHLAAHRACKIRDHSILPKAKWDPVKPNQRLSSSEIINLFRTQTWSEPFSGFSGFVKNQHLIKSQRNLAGPCSSALFYTRL